MLTIKQHDKGKNKGLWERLKHKHFWEKSWRWLGGGSTSKWSWRMSGISVQDGKARTFPAEWRGRETQKLKTLFSEPRWLQQNARGWKGGWGRMGGGFKFWADEFECYSSGNGEPRKVVEEDASLYLRLLFSKSFGSLQTKTEPMKRLLK